MVFTSGVDLVTTTVVVRGRDGRAIGDLTQDDFEIHDKGKLQTIVSFSVARNARPPAAPAPAAAGSPAVSSAPAAPAERFVAYLFDDLHLEPSDLIRVREAARRHVRGLAPADRAAVYFTSGQNMLDFTADRAQMEKAMLTLMPRSMLDNNGNQCPDLSYYEADLIFRKRDSNATQNAIQEFLVCSPGAAGVSGMGQRGGGSATLTPQQSENLRRAVMSAASRVMLQGNRQTEISMSVLRDVIDRMSSLPGCRSIVLASPGFLTPEHNREKNDLFERAIRGEVVINSLDARGLRADPAFNASLRGGGNPDVLRNKLMYAGAAASAQSNVLAEVAYGTGGTFFENNNDLDEGFRRVAADPEYIYHIGFNPQKLKLDDSFHPIKVKLKNQRGYALQARKGYYAVKPK